MAQDRCTDITPQPHCLSQSNQDTVTLSSPPIQTAAREAEREQGATAGGEAARRREQRNASGGAAATARAAARVAELERRRDRDRLHRAQAGNDEQGA